MQRTPREHVFASEDGKHGMFARRNQRWAQCSVATSYALVPGNAEGARMRRNGKRWLMLGMLGVVLGLAGACGGDDDSGAAGSGPDGEPCASPGFTETGCPCGNGAVGKRTCGADRIWNDCTCPPVTEQCVEGRDVQCNPCSGETKGRITKCLQGGTFDCGCQ